MRKCDINALAVDLQTPVRAFLSEQLLTASSAADDRRLQLLRLHAGKPVRIERAWQESGMLFGVFSPLRNLAKGNLSGIGSLTVNLRWIGDDPRNKVLDQLKSANGDGVVLFRPVA